MTDAWQVLLFFAGLLSAWALLIIVTTRWTVSRGLAAHDKRMESIEVDLGAMREDGQKREREILELRCDLPLQYVRREDAIRQETVINAKLDMLAAKIDRLRSEKHEHN